MGIYIVIKHLPARINDSRRHWWPWLALAGVLGVSFEMSFTPGALRWEHWGSNALLVIPAWLGGRRGRAWSQTAALFWLVGVIYGHFDLFAPYRVYPVHVADLYRIELDLFGVNTDAGRLTLPEWFGLHNDPVLDLLTGLAYILYLYQPFLLFIILFFSHTGHANRLAWSFLLVNILGMIIYLLYPAAPPWYVAGYGFGPAWLDTLPSLAGAARFDALTGIPYFEHFYTRSENVFGAVPSLHAAYPMAVFLCVMRLGRRWFIWTLGFALLVGFSAVYLQHHYLVDVLAGYICAGIAVGSVVWFSTAPPDRLRSRSGRQTPPPRSP